jgi:hypothetical protein
MNTHDRNQQSLKGFVSVFPVIGLIIFGGFALIRIANRDGGLPMDELLIKERYSIIAASACVIWILINNVRQRQGKEKKRSIRDYRG